MCCCEDDILVEILRDNSKLLTNTKDEEKKLVLKIRGLLMGTSSG